MLFGRRGFAFRPGDGLASQMHFHEWRTIDFIASDETVNDFPC